MSGRTGVRHPEKLKQRARALRRAGWSLQELATDLGISKGTAFLWVGHPKLGRAAKEKLSKRSLVGPLKVGRIHRGRAKARARVATAEAEAEWAVMCKDPLFLLGVGMYWGDGSKRTPTLLMSNADPKFMATWLRWCKKFAPGCVFYARIVVHDKSSVSKCRTFWKRVLGPDVEVRHVHVVVASSSKRAQAVDRLPFGTAHVTMSRGSRVWHVKMMTWIRLAQAINVPVRVRKR